MAGIWFLSCCLGVMMPSPIYDATGEWEGSEFNVMGLFIVIIPAIIVILWSIVNSIKNKEQKQKMQVQ
jgi:uncharacterized membrane protein